jgi:hypothetical protein
MAESQKERRIACKRLANCLNLLSVVSMKDTRRQASALLTIRGARGSSKEFPTGSGRRLRFPGTGQPNTAHKTEWVDSTADTVYAVPVWWARAILDATANYVQIQGVEAYDLTPVFCEMAWRQVPGCASAQ